MNTRLLQSFEGCLTFGTINTYVYRYPVIKLKFHQFNLNDELNPNSMRLTSSKLPYAECAQHELDHLNGITILDKAISITKRKEGDEFTEVYRLIHKTNEDDIRYYIEKENTFIFDDPVDNLDDYDKDLIGLKDIKLENKT